jgi:hypothetical protein
MSSAALRLNHGLRLANFHDSFSCFDKPAVSAESYQSEKADLLLEHLGERHGLDFEMFPDSWSSEAEGRRNSSAGSVEGS